MAWKYRTTGKKRIKSSYNLFPAIVISISISEVQNIQVKKSIAIQKSSTEPSYFVVNSDTVYYILSFIRILNRRQNCNIFKMIETWF